jgi:ABC-type nitrate/sulfonate/bicarbonate transport system substrate-binding protein
MDPPLRETKLVRGDIDAITGSSFTSILNLEARGVKAEDIVVMPYPQYGVKLYGNVFIAGEDFLKKNPVAVKRFLKAFSKGMKDVVAEPKAAVATVTPATASSTKRSSCAACSCAGTPPCSRPTPRPKASATRWRRA